MIAIGFVLLMGMAIHLVLSRGRPMSQREIDGLSARRLTSNPAFWRRSAYGSRGISVGAQAEDSASIAEVKAAWRTFDLSTAPFDASIGPFDLSNAPFDASIGPSDLSNAPFDASNEPFDLSNAPFDASNAPFDLSNAPFDASIEPSDLSNAPSDASNGPFDLSNEPFDVTLSGLNSSSRVYDVVSGDSMIESGQKKMGDHDLSYRQFFSHLRMIRDLLREIVDEPWVERIDFDSGEMVNTSFVSRRGKKRRETDVVWKFRRKDGSDPVYVYILIEFQSQPDPTMPVRLMVYVGDFYQALLDSQPAAARKKLPLVIPIVMNTGKKPWRIPTDLGLLIEDLDPSAEIYRLRLRYYVMDEAAYPREKLEQKTSPVADLIRLETSRNWREVHASVRRLRQTLAPSEAGLREAFGSWLRDVILPRLGLSKKAATAKRTLEEVETMLAESIDQWNRELREKSLQEGRLEGRQEGRQEGRREGRQEGEARLVLRLLRLKFGPLEPAIEDRVRSADADRLLEWGERVLTAQSLQDVFRD